MKKACIGAVALNEDTPWKKASKALKSPKIHLIFASPEYLLRGPRMKKYYVEEAFRARILGVLWILRACIVQGSQQIWVAALWYWGDRLNSAPPGSILAMFSVGIGTPRWCQVSDIRTSLILRAHRLSRRCFGVPPWSLCTFHGQEVLDPGSVFPCGSGWESSMLSRVLVWT